GVIRIKIIPSCRSLHYRHRLRIILRARGRLIRDGPSRCPAAKLHFVHQVLIQVLSLLFQLRQAAGQVYWRVTPLSSTAHNVILRILVSAESAPVAAHRSRRPFPAARITGLWRRSSGSAHNLLVAATSAPDWSPPPGRINGNWRSPRVTPPLASFW